MLFLKKLFCKHNFYNVKENEGVVDIDPEEEVIYEKINIKCGNCGKLMKSYLEKKKIENSITEEV